MRTSYDPFNRDEEAAAERARDAQREHEHWSRTQSLHGNSAEQRESAGVWIKRLPDELGEK